MDNIAGILVERLLDEQKDATKLHYYIRAMLEMIANEPVGDYREFNSRMQLKGWEDFEVDEHTFKLVMLVLNGT